MKLLYSVLNWAVNPALNAFKLLILVCLFSSNIAVSAESAAAKEDKVARKTNEVLKMDRIIAVVDQSVITEQELADRINGERAIRKTRHATSAR